MDPMGKPCANFHGNLSDLISPRIEEPLKILKSRKDLTISVGRLAEVAGVMDNTMTGY